MIRVFCALLILIGLAVKVQAAGLCILGLCMLQGSGAGPAPPSGPFLTNDAGNLILTNDSGSQRLKPG